MSLSTLNLTLYHQLPTRSIRVKWLAAELGILSKFKIEQMDIMKGTQFKPAFKALNPMSEIPIVEVRDSTTKATTVMTESAAICTWLADIVPNHELKPSATDMVALGQYHRFIALAAASIDSLLWTIRMNEIVLPPEQRHKASADRARAKFINHVIPTLEKVLRAKGVEYICEPHFSGFSTADVMIGYSLYWASTMDLLSTSPALKTYLKRLMDRPAFKKAVEN